MIAKLPEHYVSPERFHCFIAAQEKTDRLCGYRYSACFGNEAGAVFFQLRELNGLEQRFTLSIWARHNERRRGVKLQCHCEERSVDAAKAHPESSEMRYFLKKLPCMRPS
jgi:hypothetical protein